MQVTPRYKYFLIEFEGRTVTVHAESADHALRLVKSCIRDPGPPEKVVEVPTMTALNSLLQKEPSEGEEGHP